MNIKKKKNTTQLKLYSKSQKRLCYVIEYQLKTYQILVWVKGVQIFKVCGPEFNFEIYVYKKNTIESGTIEVKKCYDRKKKNIE